MKRLSISFNGRDIEIEGDLKSLERKKRFSHWIKHSFESQFSSSKIIVFSEIFTNPKELYNFKTSIEQKLSKTYTPQDLLITDESHLHEGHSGASPEGETHFRVHMVGLNI